MPEGSAQQGTPNDGESEGTPQAGPEGGTIIVTGKRQVSNSVDGKVYDQRNNPVAQSGSAADILNTVPSINVSPDGDVTLRGSSDVQILVDGKPSAMTSGESRALTLQSMSGSEIAGVEVITNPSAKYGANGSSIINIILKKDRKPGVRATLNANIGNGGRKNGAADGNYNGGPLSLHMSASARDDLRPREQDTVTLRTDPLSGYLGRREQRLAVDAHRHSSSIVLGADYALSPSQSLGVELFRRHNSSTNTIDELNREYDAADSLLRAFIRRSTGPRTQTDAGATATYSRTASDGAQLRLVLATSSSRNHRDKSYRDAFAFPAQQDQVVRVLTNSNHLLDQFTADQVLPVGRFGQLSFGADLRRIRDNISNVTSTIDPANGAETTDPQLTNLFAATQRLGAGYVTYQDKIGKLTALLGARFEAARFSFSSPNALPVPTRSITNLNPTLHLSLDLGDDRRLTANLSQSTQRPDVGDLNPFITYIDSQNLVSGNPLLRPQRVTAAEIGYEAPFRSASFTVTGYYRQTRHTVTDFSYFVADNILLTTKRNAGSGRSIGVAATLSGPLTRILKYDLSGNVFHAELNAQDLLGPLFNQGVSYSAKAAFTLVPTRRDDIRVDANFVGETLTAQGSQSGTSIFSISWDHKLKRALRLNLRITDITNGSTTIARTRTATVARTDRVYLPGQTVFVGLQYRLGPAER